MLLVRFQVGRLLRAGIVLIGSVVLLCSCSEVRGRRLLQKANRQYRDGHYGEAVATFTEAERFVPELWLLWLNKGYTCRSILIPGAKTPENEAALKCALEAFARLQTLRPSDQRGAALYVQTLFDADQFESLAALYRARLQKDPRDVEALTGLIQVYSKWPDHMTEALEWHRRKVELNARDPEAYYSAAVYIWQQLFARGGGADKAGFDPRPDAGKAQGRKVLPSVAPNDVVGQQRVDMADEGIGFLVTAVELRPKYQEAMAYANLLYRQKSFAYFRQPEEWQKCVDKAAEWRNRALLALGKVPGDDGGSGSDAHSGSRDGTRKKQVLGHAF